MLGKVLKKASKYILSYLSILSNIKKKETKRKVKNA